MWNSHKPSRYPDRIAFIQTLAQAVKAVRDARRRQWQVGVRSGGHHWIGNHVRDGGLMLDMPRMTKVVFNERKLFDKAPFAARCMVRTSAAAVDA